ncbi:GNAT family N-acetyltransferase [Sphaerochaeta pleomorpha]|nr:GNAT family N-acetyltransferase [Sphaerochaeta pleomorpha]
MEYLQTNKLTGKQLSEVLSLQELCFSKDNLSNKPFLSNELNCSKDFPCFYLAYAEGNLVSFLTCFLPSPTEAEVNGFTHPQFRNKGLFSSLLSLSENTLKPYGYTQYLLQVEPHSKEGIGYAKKHCPDIARTEYRLSLTKQIWENSSKPEPMEIVPARITAENLAVYARISASVFNESLEQSTAYISTIVNNPEREAFLCNYGETPIGVFNIHYEEKDMAILYGIGITPQYRGKGMGKQLLSLALDLVFEKIQIAYLDVDSDNPIALSLYRRIGFSTSFQVDYHTLLLS